MLPEQAGPAAKGLELYSPQSLAARCAKSALRTSLRLGLPLGFENVTLNLALADPFCDYVAGVAGRSSPSADWAMLAGNPNTPGQRCIFLVFNERGEPAAVIKAGAGSAATALIAAEEAFLKSVPPDLAGAPKVLSSFASDNRRGFAMNFVSGPSPRPDDSSGAGRVLIAWLKPSRRVRVKELPTWNRLLAAGVDKLSTETRALGEAEAAPAIWHGDFAPWNIKVQGGHWTVLDWERGELEGLPLWDWLHFVIQPAILVERAEPANILDRLENLFHSPPLIDYSNHAKIRGLEKPLTLAYLDYYQYVLRQSEGLGRLQQLADQARDRFRP